MNALDDYLNNSTKWSGQVYRGINVTDDIASEILSGPTVDMLGPSSWSTSEEVAMRFSRLYGKSVNMVFSLPEIMSGVSVTHLSQFGVQEGEVLAPSGIQYVKDMVKTVEVAGKKYIYVFLHEMPK